MAVESLDRRMSLRVHPLFLLVLGLAVAGGLIWEVIVVFCVVVLHELGHVAAATALGYRVREMTLLPFGGVAVMERESSSWSPDHEIWIAAAGPLCNGLQILAALVLYSAHLWSEGFASFFVRVNLTIALFNLLPALPLDGGRIWRAVGSRTYGYQRAGELAISSAFFCSAALAGLGAGAALWGRPHVGMWGLALFLTVSAWQMKRELPYETARWLYRLRTGEKRDLMAVRSLAVDRRVRAGEVVRYLAPDAFHVIFVLDAAGEVAFVLEERQFLDFLFSPGGFSKSIGEWSE